MQFTYKIPQNIVLVCENIVCAVQNAVGIASRSRKVASQDAVARSAGESVSGNVVRAIFFRLVCRKKVVLAERKVVAVLQNVVLM